MILYCAFGNRIPRLKCQLLDRQARSLEYFCGGPVCSVYKSQKPPIDAYVSGRLRERCSRHHDIGAQSVLVPQAVNRTSSCLNLTLVAANCSSLKPLTGSSQKTGGYLLS
jgi:hypothetical protein